MVANDFIDNLICITNITDASGNLTLGVCTWLKGHLVHVFQQCHIYKPSYSYLYPLQLLLSLQFAKKMLALLYPLQLLLNLKLAKDASVV